MRAQHCAIFLMLLLVRRRSWRRRRVRAASLLPRIYSVLRSTAVRRHVQGALQRRFFLIAYLVNTAVHRVWRSCWTLGIRSLPVAVVQLLASCSADSTSDYQSASLVLNAVTPPRQQRATSQMSTSRRSQSARLVAPDAMHTSHWTSLDLLIPLLDYHARLACAYEPCAQTTTASILRRTHPISPVHVDDVARDWPNVDTRRYVKQWS